MNMVRIFAALAAIVALSSCSGVETKGQQDRRSYKDSISNPANEHQISDFHIKHLDEDQTRSIWEVLTGKFFGHGRLFLFTDAQNRTGWYYYIMFKTYEMNIQKGSLVKLWLHVKGNACAQEFDFKVPEDSSLLRELVLGVTGKDAAKVSQQILAWKIEVFDPKGKPITTHQSWLWDMKSVPEYKR